MSRLKKEKRKKEKKERNENENFDILLKFFFPREREGKNDPSVVYLYRFIFFSVYNYYQVIHPRGLSSS